MSNCDKIKKNILSIQQNLNDSCELIVVSKFRDVKEIQCAYESGHRTFAENRVQALLERKEELPLDIKWHLIGHLQRNKVKYIAPFISLIHSVDSLRLLKEINLQAVKNNRIIPCLIQVHIAQEDSKHGLQPEKLKEFLEDEAWRYLKNIRIEGLMAMATFTDNVVQVEKEFAQIETLFKMLQTEYQEQLPHFKELSIGMSSDYLIAQKHGSTMVRVGSAIFK